MKILFVFEFGPRSGEHMVGDLIIGLCREIPDLRTRFFHGLLRTYSGGGTRPARLLNAAFMFAALPVVMLLWRPDVMFVRTAPPMMQLWGAALGRAMRVRVGCWMMDYHPEIEARVLERRRGLRWLARFLRAIDAAALRALHFVVVLDDAMERLVRSRRPGMAVIQHPTWSNLGSVIHEPAPHASLAQLGELRLVYGGNLGHAHPLETFEALIKVLLVHTPVHLYAVGASISGERRFAEMAKRNAIRLTVVPRSPLADLGKLFHAERMHAGIVLLADETAGVVSPSKFSAYLRFGLPTLYIGPPATSAEAIGTRFGAGFTVGNGADHDALRALAHRLTDENELSRARNSTLAAARFYGSMNGDTLAVATRQLFESQEEKLASAG